VYDIQCHFDLENAFVDVCSGAVAVKASPNSNQVVFCRSDCSFSPVRAFVVWWDVRQRDVQLLGHIAEFRTRLIIHADRIDDDVVSTPKCDCLFMGNGCRFVAQVV
jgi:hypothetical protein